MSCVSPFFSYLNNRWVPHQCGRCPPCKKRRVDGWVFRMLQEQRNHKNAHFITLTYDNEHLPISDNGYPTLVKKHFQDYMKRLRKLCYNSVLKYYACGEYGEERSRPHYHAIIFGVENDEMFFKAWSLASVNFGTVHVGQVSGDSIAYVTGYINKQQKHSVRRNDDREKEFSLMSKGLGANYITPEVVKYHAADLSRNFLTKDGGVRIALPRFYRDRVYTEDERAEMSKYAELAVGKSNSEQYEYYLKKYGSVDGYTFDMFQEDKRLGIVDKFYKNQKNRKL